LSYWRIKIKEYRFVMSVFSYIAGDEKGLKMPRGANGGVDGVGIKFSGAVLTGERTVEQRLREDGLRALEETARKEEDRERVEGWDPLLRDQWGRRVR
jgi:hypothetical protein